MGIRFRCECGRLLMADDERVGERLACPACGAPVMVPPAGKTVSDTLTSGCLTPFSPAQPSDADEVSLRADQLYVESVDEAARPEPLFTVTDGESWVPPETGKPAIVAATVEDPVALAAADAAAQQARPFVEEPTDAHVFGKPRPLWRRRAEEVEREHLEFLRRFTVLRAFAESLAFPIRGTAGWSTLLLPALLVMAGFGLSLMASDFPPAVVLGVITGPLLAVLAATLSFGWVAEVMRAAIEGPASPPGWGGRDFITERVWPGARALAHFAVVVVAPTVAIAAALGGLTGGVGRTYGDLLLSTTTHGVLVAVLAVYYPMSLALLTGFNSFLTSLNPLAVVRAVLQVPGEYALTVLFALGLGATSRLVAEALGAVLSENFRLLWPWLAYYSLCAVVSRLGFLVYRRKYVLGWAHHLADRVHEQPTGSEPPAGKDGDRPPVGRDRPV